MTGPRAKQRVQGFTMERRCAGCQLQRSTRSFLAGGSLCKQCRDHGPPRASAPVVPVVDEQIEALIRSVREAAGVPSRRVG